MFHRLEFMRACLYVSSVLRSTSKLHLCMVKEKSLKARVLLFQVNIEACSKSKRNNFRCIVAGSVYMLELYIIFVIAIIAKQCITWCLSQ